MMKILIKDLLLTLLMLVLGIAGIYFGAQVAYQEEDATDVRLWLGMGIVWCGLLLLHAFHALISPKHIVDKAEEHNPFDKFSNHFSRIGYFLLMFIGFTIMFYYIGWIVAFEHDYLWVDMLAGALIAVWLAVFNYLNYKKD